MSRDRKPLHPLGAAGLILLASGCVAWAWTADWRWAATGLGAFVVLAVLGSVLDSRAKGVRTKDTVPALLSSGRGASVQGNTVTCSDCPWTFTDPRAAKRMHEFALHSCTA